MKIFFVEPEESDIDLFEAALPDPNRMKRFERLIRNGHLLSRHDVVFTPHVAFNSVEAVLRINRMTADSIKAFLSGAPINLVQATALSKAPPETFRDRETAVPCCATTQ
jgi:phosphoglycerate dehydrogenase-like enzyme